MILDFFIATKDSVFLDKSIADRSRFIEIFSVVMIFVFVTYGLYNIAIAGKTLIGALEVLLSLLLFFNIRITLDKKRNYFLAASVLLTVLITMALVVFAYGGVEKTGKMWLFTVPIIIYFFMGRERGNKWMISFFLSYTAIGTLMTYNMIPPTYGLKELLLTFFALFIESVLVYYYAL
ncbi:MAG: hypothetical protein OIF32_03630, partial [Campylobacterales bacterium]|nr:hypothetical protein [Campylobacterales bacterium]